MAKLSPRERGLEREFLAQIGHLSPEEQRPLLKEYREAREAERAAAAATAPPAPTPAPAPADVPTPVQAAVQSEAGEPWGKLQTVDCPLEGYERVRATYRTNNQLGVMRNIPESKDKSAFSAWAGRFVKRIEWPYKTPPPDISTPEGFVVWEDEYQDLMLWIIADGYRAAREQAAGPAFPANA